MRFDAPGEVRAVVLSKDLIRNPRIGVFRVNEEAIHVENAGADRREAVMAREVSWERNGGALNKRTRSRVHRS